MLLLRMPLITLTSDFGIQNHALASVKGRILSGFPDASIIDITHTINGFNLQQTAYVFRQAYRHFPQGSFHFILSELYAHPSRQLLYAFEHGQHIFCADNGLLTMLFNDKPIQIFRLTEPIRPYNLITVTDLFLSAVSTVLDQHNDGMEIVTVDEIQIKHTALASYNNDMLEAQVLYIDHFGNVVVNVTRHQFDEARRGRKFTILFMNNGSSTFMTRIKTNVFTTINFKYSYFCIPSIFIDNSTHVFFYHNCFLFSCFISTTAKNNSY